MGESPARLTVGEISQKTHEPLSRLLVGGGRRQANCTRHAFAAPPSRAELDLLSYRNLVRQTLKQKYY